MGIAELVLLSIGLAMDVFAVSICKGLGMKRINWGIALVYALACGLFQAGMPLIGWALGSQVMWLIEPIDHWIAFGLLAFIGGNMIREGLSDEEPDEVAPVDHIDWREVFTLAVATSIDALSVGISFAALSVNIVLSVTLIGIASFLMGVLGFIIGNVFGSRFEAKAEITGGVILILIGTKILLEHLGILVL